MKESKNPVDNPKGIKDRISEIRQGIAKILEKPEEDSKANVFDWFLIVLITLNIVAVFVGSISDIYSKYNKFFYYFEFSSIILFTIEYLLRIWTAPCNKSKNSKKAYTGYIFSFYGIFDLLTVLPFYLPFVIGLDLRILRAFRLLRVFKLLRYNDSLLLITKVLKKEKGKLLTTVFLMIILILLASSLMYFFESEIQSDKFPNIPATLWWAVATLTTVGYGDVYPLTVLGKILGGIISILGIGLVAMPSGIIAMGLIDEIRSSPADPENIYSVLSTLDRYMGHINIALEGACKELNKRSGHEYSIIGNDVYRNKDQYGRFFKDKDEKDVLFCGLTPPLSNEKDGKDFVYSLCIPKEGKKYDKIDEEEHPYLPYGDELYIQIDRKIFEDKDPAGKLRKEIVNIVRNVYEKI